MPVKMSQNEVNRISKKGIALSKRLGLTVKKKGERPMKKKK